jgi:hypothetical protein
MLDLASGERHGSLTVERGTASFQAGSDSPSISFERLESVLARHPRFQSAKVLKLDTDGMDGRIITGALHWIEKARPVLFWEHDIGLDAAADGPALSVFRHLLDIGYRIALMFDNRGDYIETLCLDAEQQLADLSDYLPGGEKHYGYCDICAFHADDVELGSRVREIELQCRRVRRQISPTPLNEPLFRALIESQFAAHRVDVIGAIHEEVKRAIGHLTTAWAAGEGTRLTDKSEKLQSVSTANEAKQKLALYSMGWNRQESEWSEALANKTIELQALRAQMEAERYRMQLLLKDEQSRISTREAEMRKLGEVISNRSAEGKREVEEALRLARAECDRLRYALDNSLALRAARSLQFILGPIRRLLDAKASLHGDAR